MQNYTVSISSWWSFDKGKTKIKCIYFWNLIQTHTTSYQPDDFHFSRESKYTDIDQSDIEILNLRFLGEYYNKYDIS